MKEAVTVISKGQFIFEQAFLFLFKDSEDEKHLIECLMLFEMGKAAAKIKKYFESKSLKYMSEDQTTTQANDEMEPKPNEEKLENVKYLRKLLTQIQNDSKEKTLYNSEYSETLIRTQKKMRILTSLPIPPDMLQRTSIRSPQIFIGEIIHMLRPLLYCLMLRVLGTKSYKVYLISLFLDILRLFLQQNIRFYTKAEKNEYISRLKEMGICYLLRNPFYSNILKGKILQPAMNLVFGKRLEFLQTLIIYFIEVRSSYSLLM